MTTNTWGTTTKTAQSKQKEGNNQDQSRVKWHKDYKHNSKDQWIQELVLWKDKQTQQAFKQTQQEKKREDPSKHNQIGKRRDYNWYNTNAKDCKKWLQRTICQ